MRYNHKGSTGQWKEKILLKIIFRCLRHVGISVILVRVSVLF